jgi:competence ComEA-like helix-hairpin-helix protein
MDEKIDLNLADQEALQSISGIGPSLAKRIIKYREEVHPFEEVIELAAVPGISAKMVAGWVDRLTVASFASGAEAESGDTAEEAAATAVSPPTAAEDTIADPEPPALLTATIDNAEETAEPDDTAVPDEDTTADLEPPTEPMDTAPEITYVVADAAEITETDDSSPDTDPDEPSDDLPTAAEPPATVFIAPEAPESDEPTIEPVFSTASPTSETPESAPGPDPAQLRRRGYFSAILGAVFGALLGTALTLVILSSMNGGTLNFRAADSNILTQLDGEVISRTTQINTLNALARSTRSLTRLTAGWNRWRPAKRRPVQRCLHSRKSWKRRSRPSPTSSMIWKPKPPPSMNGSATSPAPPILSPASWKGWIHSWMRRWANRLMMRKRCPYRQRRRRPRRRQRPSCPPPHRKRARRHARRCRRQRRSSPPRHRNLEREIT